MNLSVIPFCCNLITVNVSVSDSLSVELQIVQVVHHFKLRVHLKEVQNSGRIRRIFRNRNVCCKNSTLSNLNNQWWNKPSYSLFEFCSVLQVSHSADTFSSWLLFRFLSCYWFQATAHFKWSYFTNNMTEKSLIPIIRKMINIDPNEQSLFPVSSSDVFENWAWLWFWTSSHGLWSTTRINTLPTL